MIPRETIASIMEAARIEEVVGEFMSLKRRGGNLIGICPFHKEKTPSFTVSPSKGIFKCFGCGKVGDSVRFIMEHEHYSYPEALRYLAKKYNIEIQESEETPEERAAQSEREAMFNLNVFAQKYFCDILHNDDEGRSVGLSYFRERDFLDPIIEKFQLGYCPDKRDAFTRYALDNGYSKELLVKTGLSTEHNNILYDRFQGRVIFPILNLTGKVIGFGGRILTSDKTKAKYLNSPESEIYNKSQTLYGIYFAKNEISRQDRCILVEGYADVLSMHQAGIENVVASSGTSLTTEQIKMISRYTKNITVLYDGDSAGIKAALRGTDMILAEGMNVRIVVLPPEEDPDSFVRHNPIEEVTRYISEQSKDFIRFKAELLLKDSGDDPIRRAQVTKEIIESISVIPDAIFRASYIKECSRILDMPEQTLMNELNKKLRAQFRKANGIDENVVPDEKPENSVEQPPMEDVLPRTYYVERDLIRLLLNYADENVMLEEENEEGQAETHAYSVASLIIDDITNDGFSFSDETNAEVFNIFAKALDDGEFPDTNFFIHNENTKIADLAADLLATPYKLDNWEKHEIFVAGESSVLKDLVIETVYRFKSIVIDGRRDEALKALQTEQDADNQMIILDKINTLDKIKKVLNEKLGIVVIK